MTNSIDKDKIVSDLEDKVEVVRPIISEILGDCVELIVEQDPPRIHALLDYDYELRIKTDEEKISEETIKLGKNVKTIKRIMRENGLRNYDIDHHFIQELYVLSYGFDEG